jgi:hypothetical protein
MTKPNQTTGWRLDYHLRVALAYWLFRLAMRLIPEGKHRMLIGGGRFSAERLA